MATISTLAAMDAWFLTSPLGQKLSAGAIQRFKDRLEFCGGEVCSFYYGDIVRELTGAEVKEMMSNFGIDMDAGLNPAVLAFELGDEVNMADLKKRLEGVLDFRFLEGYNCQGKGSCRKTADYACTSNCIDSVY